MGITFWEFQTTATIDEGYYPWSIASPAVNQNIDADRPIIDRDYTEITI